MNNLQVLSCLIVIDMCAFSRGELFTAISDVEPLLETHKMIIDDLDKYITKEENRLAILNRYLKMFKREHQNAMEDVPNYLGNPLNAFALFKRMTTDLEFIKHTIDMGIKYNKGKVLTKYADTKYPTMEDLTGAVMALSRLQETYNLNVSDLAEGNLNGAHSSKMSAGDCYEIGRILYNYLKDFGNALAWMMVALRKFNDENNVYSFKEIHIFEYISSSHISLDGVEILIEFVDHVEEALIWSKKILKLDPKHAIALKNIAHFQKIITKKEKLRLNGDTGETNEQKQQSEDEYTKVKKILYHALCRGEKDIPPEISKHLTCRYLTENHPFLRLAPIKMEYKYRNPDIVLFHEVLSDDEIEHIKELAKPRLSPATVRDPEASDRSVNYRICKLTWLRDGESPLVRRVSRRVADITGLDLSTAEELQIVNYGIGGHYLPHYDFSRKQDTGFHELVGNRIASVLFYMSDVAQGGATVFTELGLSLFPVRGAAAVWLNLHASGEGDLSTRHAACPVLRGSKWVGNKWLHTVGQEFVKPCQLEYQKEGPSHLPHPVTKIPVNNR